jgi:tetratricopeptide (TPR) repeat protein/mono/diheme cytochrome c family protein
MICRRMMRHVKMPRVMIFSMRKQKYVGAIAAVLAVLSVIAASHAEPYRAQHAFAAAQNAAAAASGTARQVTAREGTDREVTFNRDIAPIVFHICANCHRPGEAGPFSLLTYDDVKAHARQIVSVTSRRFMPPWLPDRGDFAFADELRLSDEQIALFRTWYEAGTPQGAAKDLPALPKFTEGWQMGKPDVILRATKPFTLPSGGTDQYWNFVFRAPVAETRWVRAVEIRPGNKRLVHHANLLVDRSDSARHEEAQPGDGFAGMELQIESENFDPDGHFLFWKPGTLPRPEPNSMALRLDAGDDLVLNTHLQPSGKPEQIQPSVGLYFTPQPATEFPVLLQLECDKQLDIPAGEKHFVVSDEFTLPVDVELLAIYPHAHYLGKDLLALARLPSGEEKTLIHIAHWDLNWQAVYRYAQPVKLASGTTIVMRYIYDNSQDNSANPNDPPKRVVAGNRASDEMAHLWLQVLPTNEAGANPAGAAERVEVADPRIKLEEALARHHIENNADDFEAHYNLGAMLQMRGETRDAAAQFAEAQRLRPGDATVENALGGTLLAMGQLSAAIEHLSAAVKARPDYFDVHYNLGLALARHEDFSAAVEEFRAAVRLSPKDANAEANLGSALAAAGALAEAKTHLERALTLNPQNTLARENLDQILQDAPH